MYRDKLRGTMIPLEDTMNYSYFEGKDFVEGSPFDGVWGVKMDYRNPDIDNLAKNKARLILLNKADLADERANNQWTEYFKEKGVKVSLGHSGATYAEAAAGFAAGGSIAVHTYNAMRGLNHREPGFLGASLIADEAFSEIICEHECSARTV